MKKRTSQAWLMLSVFLAVPYACQSDDPEIEAPSCIRTIIEQIASEPVRNPPASVWRWEVDGQTFYYETSDCCDQFNNLYDTDCNMVCAPDGGITGEGDGNCPEFTGEITRTLIWQDRRN
jgi:hypothetical protein